MLSRTIILAGLRRALSVEYHDFKTKPATQNLRYWTSSFPPLSKHPSVTVFLVQFWYSSFKNYHKAILNEGPGFFFHKCFFAFLWLKLQYEFCFQHSLMLWSVWYDQRRALNEGDILCDWAGLPNLAFPGFKDHERELGLEGHVLGTEDLPL